MHDRFHVHSRRDFFAGAFGGDGGQDPAIKIAYKGGGAEIEVGPTFPI